MLTEEQLELRRHGIGGSEISAILGLHPFMGPLDVFLAKVEGFRQETNDDMRRGQFLERGIANWYAEREETDLVCPLDNDGDVLPPTMAHATCPRSLATPDFYADLEMDSWRLLSIKAPRRGGDEWGETGGRVVPEYAALQLQQEDAVVRSHGVKLDPVSHLAALVDGDLRIYLVERDEELQGWLLDFAEKWWARHVVAKVPPPLDGSDGASQWLRRRFPANTQPSRPATAQEEIQALALLAAEKTKEAAQIAYGAARQVVEESIGAAGGLSGAFGNITWRSNKNGVRNFRTNWR